MGGVRSSPAGAEQDLATRCMWARGGCGLWAVAPAAAPPPELADGSGGSGDLAMREEEEEATCEGGVWDEVIKCGVHILSSIYGEGVSR